MTTHAHEFDCIVCGVHFDDERALQEHNSETHAPQQAIDLRAPAEPMGTEHAREKVEKKPNPPRTVTGKYFAAPKFGSAASGGLEYGPGPERD